MSFAIADGPNGRHVVRTMLRVIAADGTVIAEPGDAIHIADDQKIAAGPPPSDDKEDSVVRP